MPSPGFSQQPTRQPTQQPTRQPTQQLARWPARWLARCLLVTALGVPAASFAEEEAPEVALYPMTEGLMINVTGFDEDLTERDEPATCAIRVTHGDEVVALAHEMDSAMELTDIGGPCLFNAQELSALSWPLTGTLQVEGALSIGDETTTFTAATLEPSTDLPSREALREGFERLGYEAAPGEGSVDFGVTFYQEWYATRGEASLSVVVYWGTSGNLPAEASCDPSLVGPDHPCEVRAPFAYAVFSQEIEADDARALRDMLREALKAGDEDAGE